MTFEPLAHRLLPLAGDALPLLLDSALKSTLLLIVAAVVAATWRRRSAAQRHLVWSTAIATALMMPFLARAVPRIEVPLPLATVAGDVGGGPERVSGSGEVRAAGAAKAPLPARLESLEAPVAPLEARVPYGSESSRTAGVDVAELPALLFGVWLLGAVSVLYRLLPGTVALRRIARRATSIRTGRPAHAASRIATRLGLPRIPRILEGDDISIPMTWGVRRPIVLLPREATDWPTWRLEAVLLHELGHVQRRDYVSQTAAHVACALYWFNPLVWIAAHRMRVEREHACDDLVLAHGSDAERYAHDLLAMARSLRSRGRADTAALGMARSAHLRDRLIAVMDARRDRSPVTRGRTWRTGVFGLAFAAGLATLAPSGPLDGRTPPSVVGFIEPASTDPGAAGFRPDTGAGADPAVETATGSESRSLPLLQAQEAPALCGRASADVEVHGRGGSPNDRVWIIEIESGSCRASIRVEGELEFDEGFGRLQGLSAGGLLRIELSRSDTRRRLEARPDAEGRPVFAWWVDGRYRAFDAEAERWLESALLDLFRIGGYMASERVSWILSREGPDGVLAEVERLAGGYDQARYLTMLLERANLSQGQIRRLVEVAGREIDSDHEQGEVLRTVLALDDLSEENLSVILETAAAGIESNHTLAEVLVATADRGFSDPALQRAYLEAASHIDGGDHDLGRVLSRLVGSESLGGRDQIQLLASARGIDSDHVLSQLLVEFARVRPVSGEVRAAFLEALDEIQSEHLHEQVVSALGEDSL